MKAVLCCLTSFAILMQAASWTYSDTPYTNIVSNLNEIMQYHSRTLKHITVYSYVDFEPFIEPVVLTNIDYFHNLDVDLSNLTSSPDTPAFLKLMQVSRVGKFYGISHFVVVPPELDIASPYMKALLSLYGCFLEDNRVHLSAIYTRSLNVIFFQFYSRVYDWGFTLFKRFGFRATLWAGAEVEYGHNLRLLHVRYVCPAMGADCKKISQNKGELVEHLRQKRLGILRQFLGINNNTTSTQISNHKYKDFAASQFYEYISPNASKTIEEFIAPIVTSSTGNLDFLIVQETVADGMRENFRHFRYITDEDLEFVLVDDDEISFISCFITSESLTAFQAFFLPFDYTVWCCLVATLVLSFILSETALHLNNGVPTGLFLLALYSILVQHSPHIAKKSHINWFIVIVATWLMTGIAIGNTYTGIVTSDITAPRPNSYLETFNDLVDYNVTVYTDTNTGFEEDLKFAMKRKNITQLFYASMSVLTTLGQALQLKFDIFDGKPRLLPVKRNTTLHKIFFNHTKFPESKSEMPDELIKNCNRTAYVTSVNILKYKFYYSPMKRDLRMGKTTSSRHGVLLSISGEMPMDYILPRIQMILQSGLYKWYTEAINRSKAREYQKSRGSHSFDTHTNEGVATGLSSNILTVFLLAAIGWVVCILVFICELILQSVV